MVKSDQGHGKALLPVENYRNVEETINWDCKEKRRMKTSGLIIFVALCLTACGELSEINGIGMRGRKGACAGAGSSTQMYTRSYSVFGCIRSCIAET